MTAEAMDEAPPLDTLIVAGGDGQHDPTVAVLDAAFTSPYFEIGLGTGFSVLATASVVDSRGDGLPELGLLRRPDARPPAGDSAAP